MPSYFKMIVVLVLGGLTGGRGRRFLYRCLLGYDIAWDAQIGLAWVRAQHVRLASQAKIGSFTIIRNIERLELGEEARIGTFNWIFGMLESSNHFTNEPERESALIMKRGSSLTSRHIVDCTNKVVLGAFSTVAGFRSQILTHGIDISDSRQRSAPVQIGEHCLIGSGTIILKGSVVPDKCVVAAGSVFRGNPQRSFGLYSGVPAEWQRSFDESATYFTRVVGPVD